MRLTPNPSHKTQDVSIPRELIEGEELQLSDNIVSSDDLTAKEGKKGKKDHRV